MGKGEFPKLPIKVYVPPWETVQAVLDHVDGNGGRRLPEAHLPHSIHHAYPKEVRSPKAVDPKHSETAGCKMHTRFQLPYQGLDGNEHAVTACATCDGADLWPRIAFAM